MISAELRQEKDRDLTIVGEKLRNTALIVAIMKNRYGVDENVLNKKVGEIAAEIEPVAMSCF